MTCRSSTSHLENQRVLNFRVRRGTLEKGKRPLWPRPVLSIPGW